MESRSPTYNSWQAMKKRCLNKKHKGYKDYGEKGITICDEWIDSHQNFKKDMGEKPENHSLDRIDNSIGYSKENCKWSTITEQNRNRSYNKIVEYNGNRKILIEFCEELNLEYKTICLRINTYKWDIVRALSTPTNKPFNKNVNKQEYRK